MKVFGEYHPNTAVCALNLAEAYRSYEDRARAEALYQRALKINTKVLGAKHPRTANLKSPSRALPEGRKLCEGRSAIQQALEINRKVLGESHPDTAVCLNAQAALYQSKGEYAKAEPLFRRTLEISKKTLGEKHAVTAANLINLAFLYEAMGKESEAGPLSRQALEISEKRFADDMSAQSERQQLRMLRWQRQYLDLYLTVTQSRVMPADVYRYVLGWKGAVFLRQLLQAGHFAGGLISNSCSTSLNQSASACRAWLCADPKMDGARPVDRQMTQLSDRKDDLERELSSKSAEFRQERSLLALTPGDLQETLPEKAARRRCPGVQPLQPPSRRKG